MHTNLQTHTQYKIRADDSIYCNLLHIIIYNLYYNVYNITPQDYVILEVEESSKIINKNQIIFERLTGLT